MTHLIYEWQVEAEPKEELVNKISSQFNISKVLAKILIKRGYDSEVKINRFISSDVIYLQNPFLFSDMVKAVEITRKHIEMGNRILIWGDRDTDGISSVVVLYRTLKNLGADVEWYIPQSEGYGLNKETIEKYKDKVKLVITVDCGITAIEEIKYLKNLGIDVVITDHHEVPAEFYNFRKENDVIVINSYLEEYTGFRDLAGVGVVLKFVWAIMFSFDENVYNKEFCVLDIETTGLSAEENEICEIAVAKIKNFVPYEFFHTLVKPERSIPEEISSIHGITNDMVEKAPSIEKVLPDLMKFIDGTTLVIHNAEFDLFFINKALGKYGYEDLKNEVVDTLALARKLLPLRSHSLKSLSEEFFFKVHPTHRAKGDVFATVELFWYLYFFSNPKISFFIKDNLDIVLLGTISDIVPLVEDNRIITS